MPKAIQVPGGHISIHRESAEVVNVYMSGSPFAVLFRLTPTQTTELADALKHAASEEQHPDACRTCGSLTPTKGCACDPAEVEWYVFRKSSYGDGEDQPDQLSGPYDTEADANRDRQNREIMARSKQKFGYQFFVGAVRKEVL